MFYSKTGCSFPRKATRFVSIGQYSLVNCLVQLPIKRSKLQLDFFKLPARLQENGSARRDIAAMCLTKMAYMQRTNITSLPTRERILALWTEGESRLGICKRTVSNIVTNLMERGHLLTLT